jgi:hypothetical protein
MKALSLILSAWMLCVSSRAATINAATSSRADVVTAIAAASRGDTVSVPAGSSTWSSAVSITKGLRLVGAGAGMTNITGGSTTMVDIAPDATALANEETIEVNGFRFDGNAACPYMIEAHGAGASASKAFKNLIIRNCLFRNGITSLSSTGVIRIDGQVRGVISGNEFDRCNLILKNIGNDSVTEWQNSAFYPFAFGTIDNLFFEGNTIHFTSSYTGSDPGWMESGQGQRLVCRYNSWDFTNADSTEVWDIHGAQNWPGGQTGTMISEYYGNTLSGGDGYRWINHRGGWALFFNNIMTTTGSMWIEMHQYEGSVAETGAPSEQVDETYVWNNTKNGSSIGMTEDEDFINAIEENDDFFNFNASFTNGSSGIGRGTSAPTTTGNPDGSGYWVASTATPTVSPSVIQAGVLYKRVGGAWVSYYTPYTYPHPLLSATVTGRTAWSGAGSTRAMTGAGRTVFQ